MTDETRRPGGTPPFEGHRTTSGVPGGAPAPAVGGQGRVPEADAGLRGDAPARDVREEAGRAPHDTRDGVHGIRDGVHGARDGALGARDGVHGARDGALGTRDGALGTHDGVHDTRDGVHGARDGALGTHDGVHGTRDGVLGARTGDGTREADGRSAADAGNPLTAGSPRHGEAGPTGTGHDGDRTPGRLLRLDDTDRVTAQLQHAVAEFVDAPRDAVREADRALQELTERFTEAVTERRRTLRRSWQDGGADDGGSVAATDTEQLRLALRDYRELAERLLHV
ncbi:hypothetical protein BU52_23535 [Streptomyces toyocaensis]|uniref:Uncharacterized protein n=1 Tax=Streptomyces toyocaensis TaxID=55952 RepID=A0A081XMN3_STRTO|nr:hypothetical protein BU52_23535 [Streptomyces toyocaensis]